MDREQYFDEQKRRFLLYAAHSLQTPLMIISGYAQAIQQHRLPTEDAASVILDQCEKFSRLTGNMLLFSGLDDRAPREPLSPRSLHFWNAASLPPVRPESTFPLPLTRTTVFSSRKSFWS